MSLKDSLIRRGYMPENLPPAFATDKIADYFLSNPTDKFIRESRQTFRSCIYNASKRGLTRRGFSVIHPVAAHDLAQFIEMHQQKFDTYFSTSKDSLSSLSIPRPTPEGDRALAISSHGEVETVRLSKLSQYRFIAKTDISRFYHSIYTHSIPWAYHGKEDAKADRNNLIFNKLDEIIRYSQDGQTIGIPVGPDASRMIAEMISIAIDKEYLKRNKNTHCEVVRHVDDIWLGANSHADVEKSLCRYREAIRTFELDINENKTRVYSGNFCFSDTWPLEVSSRIDLADGKDLRRAGERLRAALEYTFSLAVKENDDGILRYAIHYIDKNEFYKNHWENVEPFLKRCVVHFGHTVDYVSRLIVWRHFVHDDVDHKNWKKILQTVLDNNGRLGNDSEVCWAIYACIHLDLKIGAETSQKILENCCALTIIALLHFANGKLSEKNKKSIFDNARQLLTEKSASGPYWPLALEWRSCKWLRHDEVRMNNKTIQAMADHGVVLFDAKKLPKVFEGKKVNEFGKVKRAIERRVGLYDDEEEYEESEGYEDYDAENQYENS